MTETMPTLADVLRSNRADPKDWTPDQICEAIAAAIRERDFEAVKGFMFLLAPKDPERCGLIYDLIQVVGSSDG